MKKYQYGFSIIELIVVIVILGVLAATALPKFIDLRNDADDAAVQGVAGALASAVQMNYAGCSLKNQTQTAGKCIKVRYCDHAALLMQDGIPPNYTLSNTWLTDVYGTSVQCVVTGPNGASAAFTGIRAGN